MRKIIYFLNHSCEFLDLPLFSLPICNTIDRDIFVCQFVTFDEKYDYSFTLSVVLDQRQ